MPCSLAMGEVAVAFPNDETTAEVIAARLRADGIAARVDRGLVGTTWQVSARGGQVTVLVDARFAEQAHGILGTKPLEPHPPSAFARLAVVFLVGALVLGLLAIALTIATR
jgi:hypothetical protein